MLRLLPTSLYNIPAIETWLREQACRGNHFDCFWGDRLAQFDRGAPQETVYRLEVCGGLHPDAEREALYAAAGWEYACLEPGSFLWVFRALRPDPTPIHTDPEVQAMGYAHLEKRLRLRTVLYFLCLALALTLAAALLRGLSVRRLVEEPLTLLTGNLPLYLPLLLIVTLCAAGDLLALRRLLRTLRAGVPMEHRTQARGLRPWAWRAAALVVALNMALAPWLADHGQRQFLDWRGPLSDCPDPLPYVSVEDLGAVSRKPSPSAVGWRSGLAEAYTIHDGEITYRGWGETVSGHAGWTDAARQGRTEAYRLTLPGLSGLLLGEIVRKELPEGAERLEDTRFDAVWYGTDDAGGQHLALRRGRCVLWMRAEVPEDLRDHLAEFSAALDAFT